jgi:hypothetical protein
MESDRRRHHPVEGRLESSRHCRAGALPPGQPLPDQVLLRARQYEIIGAPQRSTRSSGPCQTAAAKQHYGDDTAPASKVHAVPEPSAPRRINPGAAAGFHDKLVIHSTAQARGLLASARAISRTGGGRSRHDTVGGGSTVWRRAGPTHAPAGSGALPRGASTVPRIMHDPSRAVLLLSRRRIGIVTARPLGPPLTAWYLHQDLCVFVVIRTVDGVPYRGCLRNVPREGGVFGLHLPESAIRADQELFASHLFSPVFVEHFQPPKDSRCPGSLMKDTGMARPGGACLTASFAAKTNPRPSAAGEFGAA